MAWYWTRSMKGSSLGSLSSTPPPETMPSFMSGAKLCSSERGGQRRRRRSLPWKKAGLLEVVERGEEFALGEIAGSAEDDHDAGIGGALVLAVFDFGSGSDADLVRSPCRFPLAGELCCSLCARYLHGSCSQAFDAIFRSGQIPRVSLCEMLDAETLIRSSLRSSWGDAQDGCLHAEGTGGGAVFGLVVDEREPKRGGGRRSRSAYR